MPTTECQRSLENLYSWAAVALAFAASWWAHAAAIFTEWAPAILQLLGMVVAVTQIARNIQAMRKGKP